MAFALNPDLNPVALRAVLEQAGRMHVPDILTPETAEAVAEGLNTEQDWTRAVTVKRSSFNVPMKNNAPQSETHNRWLADARIDPDEAEMQYIYDARAISQDKRLGRVRGDVLDDFEAWLNGPEMLGFARAVTGETRIARASVQASRFLPGQQLTAHTDRDGREERLYAYVLNFSRPWFADWGGLLMFYDEGGHVARAYTPVFNSLNLFKVPVTHAVSQVATYAPGPRLAISGWFQTEPQPGSPG